MRTSLAIALAFLVSAAESTAQATKIDLATREGIESVRGRRLWHDVRLVGAENQTDGQIFTSSD